MINLKNRYIVKGSTFMGEGNTTAEYMIPVKEGKVRTFHVIASIHKRPGLPDLEHVSVAGPKETPRWETMCIIKDLFWDDEDEVIQYHPKKSEYVNMHPRTLHMWREVK